MDECVRKVEREILDTRHRHFPLMRRPRWFAAGHLLKVVGDLLRDLPWPHRTSGMVIQRANVKNAIMGLAQAVRWVLTDPETRTTEGTCDWRVLDDEATELLVWGARYARLATDHIMWSRGLLTCTCNPAAKTIEFGPAPQTASRFMLGQVLSELLWADAFHRGMPAAAIRCIFRRWDAASIVAADGRWMQPGVVRESPGFEDLLEWTRSELLVGQDENAKLDGYTPGDFARIHTALHAHTRCLCLLEERADALYGQENPIGSTCLSLPRNEMADWLAEASGVPPAKTSEILQDLTFDANSIHSSILLTPVLQTSDDVLMISPRLFCDVHPFHMFATALISGKRRRCYESMISDIEAQRVKQVAVALESLGLQAIDTRTIRSANGHEVTPDLLVWDEQGGDLLVVEYKHSLPPSEPRLVYNRLLDLRGWQERLEQYREFVMANPQALPSAVKRREPTAVLALLLFASPMPLPVSPPENMAFSDWVGLHNYLSNVGRPSVAGIWNWARNRPEVEAAFPGAKLFPHDVRVEEWTYRRWILGPAPG